MELDHPMNLVKKFSPQKSMANMQSDITKTHIHQYKETRNII